MIDRAHDEGASGASTPSWARAVRARRKALQLRQAELADLADCSTRFVVAVEQGKATVRLDKLLDVLRVLGLGLALGPGDGNIVLAEVS